jgi:hypothetical protein
MFPPVSVFTKQGACTSCFPTPTVQYSTVHGGFELTHTYSYEVRPSKIVPLIRRVVAGF